MTALLEELFDRPVRDEASGLLADLVRIPGAHAEATAAVPPIEQQQSYTCGPAALAAVIRRFGRTVGESYLSRQLGSDPDVGTPPAKMLAGARALGLDAGARESMTLAELERHVILGRPVLVCLQALNEPAGGWEGGHWCVVTGRDGGTILLADPATGDAARRVPKAEFVRRWHDRDGDGRIYRQFGIVCREGSGTS